MQMHATFVLKCGKCRLRMQQCNVMESCTMFMTFFPYFVILIWFLKKHRLTVLLKAVIIHATLSYLSQISLGTPLEYMSCLIYSLDNFGVTTMEPFNQSTKIPGLVTPFFCLKHRRVRTFDLPLGSPEAHAQCPSLPQCRDLRYQSLFCFHNLVAGNLLGDNF